MLHGLALLPLASLPACAGNPRGLPAGSGGKPAVSTLTLMAEGARQVDVTICEPATPVAGTILFSHGAGSAPDKYPGMIDTWAAAGWRVLAPLHVDSREHPRNAEFTGLASWRTRIEDMRLLSQHIGDTPYIAAGHSYGGLVALTLGGAAAIPPEGIDDPLSDPKVSAVVAFSPPAPIPVLITQEGYGKIAVPALIQTGTADFIPGSDPADGNAWRGHLAPFDAAVPGGHRYALVLEGVDHYFGGAICDYSQPGPPRPDQLDKAVDIADRFMRGFGLNDAQARAALNAELSGDLPVMLMQR